MTLRVLCAPWFPRNPYQPLLARALAAHDVDLHGIEVRDRVGPELLPAAREFRPHLLHLHWVHPWIAGETVEESEARAGRFLAEVDELRRGGTRVVWTAHNLVNHEERHPEVDARVTRAIARRAARIIVHGTSAWWKLMLYTRGSVPPWRVRVIPHGNYVDAYPNTIGRDAARAELSIPDGQFVFLFIGRIRAYKGLLRLVKTFANTFDDGDHLLLIAGKSENDEERVRWKVIARRTPHVRLEHGHVPDDKLQVFLNAADVVVLPYRDALTSGAALLAMSFGKAVVAPSLKCITEVVPKDGAFLFDADQRRTVKQALKDAAKRRDRLDAMGRANLAAARRFDWDSIGAKTARLYRQVASDVEARGNGERGA